MGKKLRTLVALALSAIMIMGLSITAFAGQNTVNTNYDVTFKFIQRDVRSSNPNPTNIPVYSDITVSVSSGDTLKDALDDAMLQEDPTLTDFATTWSGTGPYYLEALKLDGTNYANNYVVTGDSEHGTYTGTSWMWDYDDVIDANYPGYYLDQVTVTGDETIYLIYETSSFTW